ncbi:MAG: LicD family protein, partial [Ruminococcus flavefaciens]|nr:LicD family protein [Ruminococcus flavefaciens]
MPDYLKCCRLLANDSTYGFDSMLNPNQEKLSISLISKIRSNTLFSEYRNFPLRLESAIGIDIFPLGGFPSDESEQNRYMRELVDMGDLWKEKVVLPYDTEKYSEDVQRELIEQSVNLMSKYDYESSEYVADVYCNRFIRNHLNRKVPREYYDRQILLPFQNEMFAAPGGFDYILEKYYGDYMKIPDEKDRAKRTYDKVYRIE